MRSNSFPSFPRFLLREIAPRLIIDRRARLAQGLGLFQGLFAVDLLRPEAAARDVIPIEVLRRRAIREPDFERAALRHGPRA